MSPIGMFLAAYGNESAALLGALGIHQMGRDKITLTPDVLDIKRIARRKESLNRSE